MNELKHSMPFRKTKHPYPTIFRKQLRVKRNCRYKFYKPEKWLASWLKQEW